MAVPLIVGTVVMIGLAVAVLLVSSRGRGWYDYTPQPSREDVGWTPNRGTDAGAGLLARPGTWIVAFVLVATLGIAGIFLFAAGSTGGSSTLLLGSVAGLVVVYLVGGVYLMARERGHSSAAAVFESATASGALLLLFVLVQLVFLG